MSEIHVQDFGCMQDESILAIDNSVHGQFERQVLETPDRVAVTYGDSSLTYEQLNRKANGIAHFLLSNGVGSESLIAIAMERSIELISCILGVLKAGGAYLPLDYNCPPERLSMIIQDAEPPIILTTTSLVNKFPRVNSRLICLDLVETNNENSDNPEIKVRTEDLAYVMFTSGSTGRPKGVTIEHRSIVRLVKGADYADFSSDNVFLQFAPITFDASTFEIWGALLNGARLVIMPEGIASLAELGRAIHENQVTTLWLTAGLFHLMVDERIDDLKPLRQLLAGGDVLSVAHVRKVLNELECDLINGYGPTENTTFTCCYKVPRDAELGRSIPIGRPINKTQIHILNEDLEPVSQGEAGEIYIGGDGLARGYLNRDDLTAERFVMGPFHEISSPRLYRSGDLGRVLPDGNIEFLGRADKQVKIRGFRVELEEIEIALTSIAGVREAVVVANDISTTDKQLVAFVVLDRECGKEVCGLRQRLEAVLPEYMVPSYIFPLDALPLTPNGKVDRSELITTIPSKLARNLPAPATGIERNLAGMLEEILVGRSVGANDNFFDLGASSLHLARFHNRLQSTFDPDLKIISLFQNPTIKSLARFLEPSVSIETDTTNARERAIRQRGAYARQRRMHNGGH